MRTSEIARRPVVTMDGADVAQIKDIVYSAGGGAVGGFTLAGRGLFSGPLDVALPWPSVAALGPDAVMILDATVLQPVGDVLRASEAGAGGEGNILGSRVLTDTGIELGQVIDVIVEVTQTGRSECDVIGYEIESSDALGNQGTRLLIPLPDAIAASGEHLIVPASAKNFVRQDLAGFGAAVDDFRDQLRGHP